MYTQALSAITTPDVHSGTFSDYSPNVECAYTQAVLTITPTVRFCNHRSAGSSVGPPARVI